MKLGDIISNFDGAGSPGNPSDGAQPRLYRTLSRRHARLPAKLLGAEVNESPISFIIFGMLFSLATTPNCAACAWTLMRQACDLPLVSRQRRRPCRSLPSPPICAQIDAGEAGWFGTPEGAILHGGVIATAFEIVTEEVFRHNSNGSRCNVKDPGRGWEETGLKITNFPFRYSAKGTTHDLRRVQIGDARGRIRPPRPRPPRLAGHARRRALLALQAPTGRRTKRTNSPWHCSAGMRPARRARSGRRSRRGDGPGADSMSTRMWTQ